MSLKESESTEPLRTAQVETTSASTSTAPGSVSTSWIFIPTPTSSQRQSISSSSTVGGVLDHHSDPVSGGADSVHLQEAARTNEPQSMTPPLPPPRGTAQELFLTMATDPGGWFGVLIFRCFLVFPVDSR